MRNTITRSLLRGAALALVAIGSTALVADEGARLGDQLSEAQPQQRPQPKPQPKQQAKQQQKESRFGGYLSLALPQGDLGKAVGTGFGLGGFWEMPLGDIPNLTGVASAQYLMFGKKTQAEFFGTKVESSGSEIGANYDVHYYFGGGRLGFYGLAGIGYHNCSMKVESNFGNLGLGNQSSSDSEGKFGFAVGAGYDFTSNLGAEAKYFSADDWNYVQASIKYRF